MRSRGFSTSSTYAPRPSSWSAGRCSGASSERRLRLRDTSGRRQATTAWTRRCSIRPSKQQPLQTSRCWASCIGESACIASMRWPWRSSRALSAPCGSASLGMLHPSTSWRSEAHARGSGSCRHSSGKRRRTSSRLCSKSASFSLHTSRCDSRRVRWRAFWGSWGGSSTMRCRALSRLARCWTRSVRRQRACRASSSSRTSTPPSVAAPAARPFRRS
mmetsp:Transcript_129633/g.375451  ORF Transcript_129633/g.375451 Transcript_129633/m.375451 type:complete len:217 (+) Transcript_129633:652-1302(+)